MATASFRTHPPALCGALYGLQGDHLCHRRLLQRSKGNLCSGAWSSSSTSLYSHLGVHNVCLICLFLNTFCAVFLPFLTHTVTEVSPPRPWAQPHPAVAGWIRLCPAGAARPALTEPPQFLLLPGFGYGNSIEHLWTTSNQQL